jgi:hypothetical protein
MFDVVMVAVAEVWTPQIKTKKGGVILKIF